jgi:hypothetical protein
LPASHASSTRYAGSLTRSSLGEEQLVHFAQPDIPISIRRNDS